VIRNTKMFRIHILNHYLFISSCTLVTFIHILYMHPLLKLQGATWWWQLGSSWQLDGWLSSCMRQLDGLPLRLSFLKQIICIILCSQFAFAECFYIHFIFRIFSIFTSDLYFAWSYTWFTVCMFIPLIYKVLVTPDLHSVFSYT
jgi:hypothetical protein